LYILVKNQKRWCALQEDLDPNKKPKRKIPISAYIFVAILIILAGVYSYYMSLPDDLMANKEVASIDCVNLCIKEQSKGTILSEGPCLSDEIVEGWACDVVHNPRVKLIDNKEQNQCQSCITGEVKHFVEVNQECKFVRAV